MEESTPPRTVVAQTARLDQTLKELQNRVRKQEVALERLRITSRTVPQTPSQDPSAQLRQLRVLVAAYEASTPMEPYLPTSDSPLPALLTLRTLHRTIQDSKISLATSQSNLDDIEQMLEKELTDLTDAKLLTQHLEQRIESLRRDITERTQKSPGHIARDMIRAIQHNTKKTDKSTLRVIKAFNAFTDDHLAPMLAAEELGGPVVGDMLDVDELALESGFNSQGTMKKQRRVPKEDKRQRRIDEIWGQPPDGGRDEQPWDETRAAAAEMRDLTEKLLNSIVDEGDGYVEIKRESAASRFLLRSRVVQLHPRNAHLLRLVNFGQDIDD